MAWSAAGFSFNLCADDYAISKGVSRGILEALEAGRLTATSVMTTRTAWPKTARDLRHFEKEADIGLHLNLTLGAPLGPMPSFAPRKKFPDIRNVIRLVRKNELSRLEIREEIFRQLDAFADCYGKMPDFLDGHQHVQILPKIRTWLFECLKERGLQEKIWLRNSADRIFRIFARNIEVKKALAIALLGHGFARDAAAQGFATNDGFAGFSAFDATRDLGAIFPHYLRAPGYRHLVMCHPGYCDEELVLADPVTLTRERELNYLLSQDFIDLMERRGAVLRCFKGWK
jgi:predicted glycoside hydrolase/deacetylase ChbG (UPF0249 family)